MKKSQGIKTPQVVDPVFKQLGLPFLVDGNNVVLNDRAVATKFAAVHTVKFNADAKCYERYLGKRGLWVVVDEVALVRELDNFLIQLGKDYDCQEFVRRISAAKLKSVCNMIRPHGVQVKMASTAGLVHASNGLIDLCGSKPKLVKHDPKYPFYASSEIQYDSKAACPQFLGKFLGTALEKADIALLRKYCGSMLLGPNTCHGILIIRGTPGGGKSTMVNIVEKILGENNVAHLRTSHLGGRFETSAFLGKRLLVGKDVPGETLAVDGARMLKSLVGDDLMQAEIKFNPAKQQLRGDYHVVIVSNNNLHIALDGDRDAWRRRLLVVDFQNEKPAKPITNFAEKLLAAESSGILNWLIEGAMAYRTEMEKHGHLQLTEAQQARVETLLQDSDSVAEFVKQAIVPREDRDVTSEELLVCYYKKCDSEQWNPVAQQTFLTRVPDLIGQMFKKTRRNDIRRDDKIVRGFKGITLA